MMGLRFFLMFYIAYFLDAKTLGEYGLFVGTVTYCVFLVGFEHYSISQRELMSQKKSQWLSIIQNQFAANLFLYCLIAPFFIFIFIFNLLPWKYFFWFFILLILEHFSQELIRFKAGMSLQIQVSAALFLRSGFWVLLCLPIMYFYNIKNLNFLFLFWSISCLLSIYFSIFHINKILPLYNFKLPSIKQTHLFNYNSSTLQFFLGTSVIKILFIGDRYLVEYFCSSEILGTYIFFIGIAMTSVSLIDPAITSFMLPKIVDSFQNGPSLKFKKLFLRYALYVFIFSSTVSLLTFKVAPYIFNLLGNKIYLDNIKLFREILLVTFIYALSLIPHYGLLAKKYEKHILISNLITFLVFALCICFFSGISNIFLIPISLQISFVVLLILKMFFFIRK